MKISLIMDPQDPRCKELKTACKNNNVQFKLLQCDYDEHIARNQREMLNQISDGLIFHSNIGYKRENRKEKDRKIWDRYSSYIRKETIDKAKFCINKRGLERKIGFKYNQYVHLKSLGKDYTIPTFIYQTVEDIKKGITSGELQYPFIMKINGGRRGENVHLIKNEKELKNTCENKNIGAFIFQNFIENTGDFRVLYLGGKILGIIRRFNKDSHLNNVSSGGSVFKVTDKNEIKEISKIVKDAGKAFNTDFAGIDIIYDEKKKKYFFLEINNFSQRAGFRAIYPEIDVADLVVKYIIKKVLEVSSTPGK